MTLATDGIFSFYSRVGDPSGGEPPTPAFRLPKGVGSVVLAHAPRLIPFGYLAASNERARLESLARADKAQEARPGLRPA